MHRRLRRPLLLLLSIVAALAVAAPAAGAAEAASPACEADCLRVYSIKNYTYLGPDAEAHVKVVDEYGGAIRGAVVYGVWTLPDGTTLGRYDMIGTRLRAEFPLYTDQGGTATFTVAGITKAGYTFDPAGSALLSISADLGDPAPPPPPQPELCVVECVSVGRITMSERGGDVRAVARVVDEDGDAVVKAVVAATWTLPGDTEVTQTLSTNKRGKARFEIPAAATGVYTITINDVTFAGLTYEPDVTSNSYTVG